MLTEAAVDPLNAAILEPITSVAISEIPELLTILPTILKLGDVAKQAKGKAEITPPADKATDVDPPTFPVI